MWLILVFNTQRSFYFHNPNLCQLKILVDSLFKWSEENNTTLTIFTIDPQKQQLFANIAK